MRPFIIFTALLVGACTQDSAHSPRQERTDSAPPSEADSAPPSPEPAQVGVCTGPRTSCDVPELTPLVSPNDNRVNCTEGTPFTLVWTAQLGKVDGPVPGCPAVDPVVTQGAGSYWSIAEVREPSTTPLGSGAVGFVVHRFDSMGNQTLAMPSDLRGVQDGLVPDGTVRVAQANSSGELFWETASPDGATLELRHYSTAGKLMNALRPVSGATPTFADARWLPDGSALIAYRYLAPHPDAAPGPQLIPGIARIDAAGRVQWNQAFFSKMAEADATLSMSIAIGGIDDAGDSVIQDTMSRTDGSSPPQAVLLKLDPDGNVVWGRSIDGATFIRENALQSSVGVSADGTVRAAYTVQSIDIAVEEIDPDGNSRGRLLASGVNSMAMVIFDPSGRALVARQGSPEAEIHVIDRTAASCESRSLSTPACALNADGTQNGCDDPYISLTDSGDVFFGVAGTVGLAKGL